MIKEGIEEEEWETKCVELSQHESRKLWGLRLSLNLLDMRVCETTSERERSWGHTQKKDEIFIILCVT